MSAGEGLRTLRKEMGKSIRVVAELAGVSYGNLCEIERGKQSPYIYTVKSIAEATNMDMHRLAHYAFDLDPPEYMELDGILKDICDLVLSMNDEKRYELKGYILRMLDEGGDFYETAWEPEAGYG